VWRLPGAQEGLNKKLLFANALFFYACLGVGCVISSKSPAWFYVESGVVWK
jgi:hypothetical protein